MNLDTLYSELTLKTKTKVLRCHPLSANASWSL